MLGLDTNVLVRYLVRDGSLQFEKAIRSYPVLSRVIGGMHFALVIFFNFASPAKLAFGGFTKIRGIRCVAALAG